MIRCCPERKAGLILPFVLATAAACLTWADDGLPRRFEFTSAHMGTTVQLTLYAASEQVAKQASRAAFDRLKALDQRFSDYRADSEIRRLTADAAPAYTGPVAISEDLFQVLQPALQLSRETDGAFDVTVGPLSRLWRRAHRTNQLPSPARIETALNSVGYRGLQLDTRHQTVRLTLANMRLDLGGIAKGYAVDEALRIVREHGIPSALVALGGDLAVGGPPPEQSGWTVSLAPLGIQKSLGTLRLVNCGVASSGDATQYLESKGHRYSHVIDPRSGAAVVDGWGVTVVARSGMLADALASVASVVGPDASDEVLAAHQACACFARSGHEQPEIRKTPSFPMIPLRTGNQLSYPPN